MRIRIAGFNLKAKHKISAPDRTRPRRIRNADLRAEHEEPASVPAIVKSGLWAVMGFSILLNLLMLAGPLFMLQIYDRVLTSQSLQTLAALTLLVVVLFVFFGLFHFIRMRLLAQVAAVLDRIIAGPLFARFAQEDVAQNRKAAGPLASRSEGAGQTTAAPLLPGWQAIRQFLSSGGAAVLFDLPWIPVYIAVIFMLHPDLGWFAIGGALLLVLMTLLNERFSKPAIAKMADLAHKENNLALAARRNGEVLKAMRLVETLQRHWQNLHEDSLRAQDQGSRIAALFGSLVKSFRLMIQSLILALGAWLAILQEISAGAIVAASILFSRAMAPLDQTIAQWRTIGEVLQGGRRLLDWWQAMKAEVGEKPRIEADLPAPKQSLTVDKLSIRAPVGHRLLLRGVSFSLEAGEALGIIGASGSGKSTLARGLLNIWPPASGEIRLDGAEPGQYRAERLGKSLGYLPQDIELFEGTVADNIARFQSDYSFDDILAAGRLSGAHDMILRLPEGYDTRLGAGHYNLSAGQRQRIALARAVIGPPFLVVLDEPNSNLDSEGEKALNLAINRLRRAGSIVIVIAHRKSVLASLDKLLFLEDGAPLHYGPRDQVLADIRQSRIVRLAGAHRKQGGKISQGAH